MHPLCPGPCAPPATGPPDAGSRSSPRQDFCDRTQPPAAHPAGFRAHSAPERLARRLFGLPAPPTTPQAGSRPRVNQQRAAGATRGGAAPGGAWAGPPRPPGPGARPQPPLRRGSPPPGPAPGGPVPSQAGAPAWAPARDPHPGAAEASAAALLQRRRGRARGGARGGDELEPSGNNPCALPPFRKTDVLSRLQTAPSGRAAPTEAWNPRAHPQLTRHRFPKVCGYLPGGSATSGLAGSTLAGS